MIPKIIHYCWFGRNPKSELAEVCIESWKKYLPDYEIIEWNEDRFDISQCRYVEVAYKAKKWAHVSDYVRAFALYSVGGIYLDTDVEIRKSLNEFLHHKAFSGFESKGYPFTALWGAEKAHHWPSRVLSDYQNKEFTLETNTISVSRILEIYYKINPYEDRLQIFNNDIYIYPSHYFCLDFPNYATHHFEGSWLDSKHEVPYKHFVHSKFFTDNFFDTHDGLLRALEIIQDRYRINSLSLIKLLLEKGIRKMIKPKKV